MKKIATITPEILDEGIGCFALVFELKWVQLFGKVPTFDVMLDKNWRMIIKTRECIKK